MDRPSDRVIRFVENLTTSAGAHAGQPFLLRPWQRDIVRRIYDPLRPDGRRQVRHALITMPRKNGKTELAAALALYHLLADGELAGQVYSAAADREQAALVFNVAAGMVNADPELKAMINIVESRKRMVHYASGSIYQAISADAKTKHGFNTSCMIYDELAQAPNRDLYDVLTTSTGARAQPLSLVISTQSPDPNHIMSELVDYGRQVAAGTIDDPTFAPVIFAADADADPWDEATWFAANPALGDFRSLDEMREAAAMAKRVPARESAFRALYLNQPVGEMNALIGTADWNACGDPVDADALVGRACWGGLDLGSTRDLSALVLVFPDESDLPMFDVLVWFWRPSDTMAEAERTDRAPYTLWRDQGMIEGNPGRALDKRYVVRRLADLLARFDVRTIAADRWGLAELEKLIADEGIRVPLRPFGQGFRDMSPAVDVLERAVLNGQLRHGNHPVLRWNAANVAVEIDPAGNRKLSKRRSTGRIDGIVALAMALAAQAQDQTANAGRLEFFVIDL